MFNRKCLTNRVYREYNTNLQNELLLTHHALYQAS